MKLYDEMPTHVLTEYKVMGDFKTCLPHEGTHKQALVIKPS